MNEFPSIDRVHEMLEEISEEIPEKFFEKLNEGVILLPNVKLHPQGLANDLYILGEYHRSITGNRITIYYGSFKKTCFHLSEERLREKLKHTLLHEFTHHMEAQAGERGLEKADRRYLQRYVNKHHKD